MSKNAQCVQTLDKQFPVLFQMILIRLKFFREILKAFLSENQTVFFDQFPKELIERESRLIHIGQCHRSDEFIARSVPVRIGEQISRQTNAAAHCAKELAQMLSVFVFKRLFHAFLQFFLLAFTNQFRASVFEFARCDIELLKGFEPPFLFV